MTGGKNCGKREILFRIMDHHWVNLWECIYEFVYQGLSPHMEVPVRSLVLNNTDLYKASISLFFIFCLKGENNMHLFIQHIFATLDFFIQFCILYGIFLWINVIFADRANGHQRTGSCIYEFISTFYLLCDHLCCC